MSSHDSYTLDDANIFVPRVSIEHREDEYDSNAFAILKEMQQRHFWYRGRHRFLLYALRRALNHYRFPAPLSGVDLGGGCGGWIRYLQQHASDSFAELALADSSRQALTLAADEIGPTVSRYQIDLLRLAWNRRWNVAFLLDVLEHIPEDADALRQIRESLVPGGLLFITTPALKLFWSYNDTMARHVRRYSRTDYKRLAGECGFELVFSRYFMFYLSPLLVLSRLKSPDLSNMTPEEVVEHARKTHKIPSPLVNRALSLIFSAETPIGIWLPFPWGTSVLGVLRRKD